MQVSHNAVWVDALLIYVDDGGDRAIEIRFARCDKNVVVQLVRTKDPSLPTPLTISVSSLTSGL